MSANTREYRRAWKARNLDKVRAYEAKYRETHPGRARAYQLMARYGLTQEGYDFMLAKQGGVCAICERSPKKGANLHVDHEHVKGYKDLPPHQKRLYVRGLLCAGCNRYLLGNRKQETLLKLLRNAYEYLARYEVENKEMTWR